MADRSRPQQGVSRGESAPTSKPSLFLAVSYHDPLLTTEWHNSCTTIEPPLVLRRNVARKTRGSSAIATVAPHDQLLSCYMFAGVVFVLSILVYARRHEYL